MSQPSSVPGAARTVLVLSLMFCLLSGCSEAEKPAGETYRVRGVIVSLPAAGNPVSELRIHHEAIPTFINKDGRMEGMGAMTMPFTPATGVSLDGLEVGDKVVFTLRMNFATNRSEVAEFSELSQDTELNFAAPGAGGDGGGNPDR